MNAPRLILASASPRRKELLTEAGFDFVVIPALAEELHDSQLTARELCQLNAHRKARSVAKQYPDDIILGADTLVYLGTTLYGKPSDRADARRMLGELQGTRHQVVTGVSLIQWRSQKERLFAETTHVTFRHLKPDILDEYLRKVETLDKAGAYAIQEQGDALVESIEGSYSNVVGLPVERISQELRLLGISNSTG
ncbi:MAG: maf [Verrucomicrobiales bacterium]|nr:maf [Verrucomicrobiales bacterium]